MSIDLFVTLVGAWPSGLINLLSTLLGSRVNLKADDAFPSRGLQENDLSVLASATEAAIRIGFYLAEAPNRRSIDLPQINRQLKIEGVSAVEVESCVKDAD